MQFYLHILCFCKFIDQSTDDPISLENNTPNRRVISTLSIRVNNFWLYTVAHISRPKQNDCRFADDIFKSILLQEDLYFVPWNPIDSLSWF